MEEKKFIIYAHINKINGKIYVGQTNQTVSKRWSQGYDHNEHFTNAIKKYGWDGFEHIILEDNLTMEEADYLEYLYIEEWDLLNPEKGYNKVAGGVHSPFIEKWKDPDFRVKMHARMSEVMKKRWEDPETRAKWSQASKDRWENPEYREKMIKVLSDSTKKRWQDPEYREARMNDLKQSWINPESREKHIQQCSINAKNNWNNPEYRAKMCKAVVNIETGIVFESAAEAARWCGLKDRGSITRAVKGQSKTSGKHPDTGEPLHWKYLADVEEVMDN